MLALGGYLLRFIVVSSLMVLTFKFAYSQLDSLHPWPDSNQAPTVEIDDPAGLLRTDAPASPTTDDPVPPAAETDLEEELESIFFGEPTRLLIRVRPDATPMGGDLPIFYGEDPFPTCSTYSDCLVSSHPDYFDEVRVDYSQYVVPKPDALVIDIVAASSEVKVFYGRNPEHRSSSMEQLLAGTFGSKPDNDQTPPKFASEKTGKAWVTLSHEERDDMRARERSEVDSSDIPEPTRLLEHSLQVAVARGDLDQRLIADNLGVFSRALGYGPKYDPSEWQVSVKQGAISLSLLVGGLSWVLLSMIHHLLGVGFSRLRHPLGTKRARKRRRAFIAQVRTDGLMHVDQLQLDSLVVPDAYKRAFTARSNKWLDKVTELGRREFEFFDSTRGPDGGLASLKHLSATSELAELVQRGRVVLDLDSAGLANPAEFDPVSHPSVASLREGFEAAQRFQKAFPDSGVVLARAVEDASAALRSAVANPVTVQEVAEVLRSWDRAAQELANATVGLPAPTLTVRTPRHSWAPFGRREVRAEIKAMQLPALERCLTPGVAVALPTIQGDRRTDPTSGEEEVSAQASGDSTNPTQTPSLHDFTPESKRQEPLQVSVGPVALLAGTAVALFIGFLFFSGSIIEKSHEYPTQYAAVTWIVCAIAIAATMGLARVSRWLWQSISSFWNKRQMTRHILTGLLMGEDNLRLEVERLTQLFPNYAQSLQRRLETFLSCRDDLLQLVNADGHQIDWSKEDPFVAEFAQVVRVQAYSLWRTADILRQREGSREAWRMEFTAVVNAILDKHGPNAVFNAMSLNTEVELGQISMEQALSELDDLTQTYRLARIIRAVPVKTRVGSWYAPPLDSQQAFLSQHRELLEALTVLNRPVDGGGYVLSEFSSELLRIKGEPLDEVFQKFLVFLLMPLLGVVLMLIGPSPQAQSSWEWKIDRSEMSAKAQQVVVVDPENRIANEDLLRSRIAVERFPIPVNIAVVVLSSQPPVGSQAALGDDSQQERCRLSALMIDTSRWCGTGHPRPNTLLFNVYDNELKINGGSLVGLPYERGLKVDLEGQSDPTDAILRWLDGKGSFTFLR
ncbi:MAG: hypothetical protein Q4P06_03240 [Actinomycetaceae bacterium]|nr:hypothetical protein [Actinomycetaceae bacterium]